MNLYDKLVYVAGPMSGIADYNFPAFHAAAEDLRSRGVLVVSPAELEHLDDYGANGVTPEMYRNLLIRDLGIIANPDNAVEAIVVLPGWEDSKGATAEVALGRALGLPIIVYPELHPVEAIEATAPHPERPSPYARPTGPTRLAGSTGPTSEIRMTDPVTGGQKGVKPERLDLLPIEPLMELSRVYGFGASKYSDYNYLKGFPWSYSIAALQRHVLQWISGETRDSESSYHHLAHAAWHCFSLMLFQWKGLGTDNRMCTTVSGLGGVGGGSEQLQTRRKILDGK